MKKQAFTLVELIVVITVVAILSAIAFIGFFGHSKEARDSKRLADATNLLSKINIEQTKGKSLSELIINTKTESGKILGVDNSTINTFGVSNFDILKQDSKNFKDPSNQNLDYPVAYAIGGTGSGAYKFFEIATVSEKENTTKIFGNYYKLDIDDEESLFLTGGVAYKEGSVPVYNISGGATEKPTIAYNCIDSTGILRDNIIISNDNDLKGDTQLQNTNSGELCYYECNTTYSGAKCDNRTVFGDEDSDAIQACNERVKQTVGTSAGGYQNWLWVPASKFTKDGVMGIGMDDNFYKRTVTYNNINYTCNGFAVAKYEMTYEDAKNPNSYNGIWNTYTYVSNKSPISRDDRYPVTDLTQAEAFTACSGIGTRFHLITNNEWMAIARNIESKANNWSTGKTGSGYISTGLSSDQTTGCKGEDSKAIYTGLQKTWGTKTGVGTNIGTNPECDTKRQLTLSNNEKIWDLSGNVWEHVNKANTPWDGVNYSSNTTRLSNACGGSGRYSFAGNDGVSQCGYANSYTYANFGPSTPGLNASNGIGKIYSYNTSSNVFVRGGVANDHSYAGIFSTYLAWGNTTRDSFGGFRCSL